MILNGEVFRVAQEATVNYGNIEPTGRAAPKPLAFTVVKVESVADEQWQEKRSAGQE